MLIAAIIVFFTVIFPELTARHINMGNYVKANFAKESYVDGYINGTLTLDYDKAYDEMVTNKIELPMSTFKSYFDYYEYKFENKSQNDTVTTEVKYQSKYYDIKEVEKRLGVRFDEKSVANVKLADELDKNKITVEKPIELNMFEFIDKCYYNRGLSDKNICVAFESKDFKKDGYEFSVSGFDGTYGSSSGYIYVKKDSSSISSATFKADTVKADKGDKTKVTLEFSSDYDHEELLYGTPFVIKKTSQEYTFKPQPGFTLDTAKSKITKVRQKVRDIYACSFYTTTLNESYLFTARNKSSETVNMVVTLITKKSKSTKSVYYIADIRKNVYVDEHASDPSEKIKYDTYDSEYNYKSKAELWKKIKNEYSKNYKIQLIKG